jgi:hypothetical protein
VNRGNNWKIGVLAVVAIVVLSAWPLYNWWRRVNAVDATLYGRVRALVEKNLQLQPDWVTL